MSGRMFELRRVLAATDGSEHGAGAVVTGASLAARAGASFDVVTVVEVLLLPDAYAPPGVEGGGYEERFMDEVRRAAAEQSADAGAPDAPIHVRAGIAAPGVVEQADELEADLTVVGAHPRPALARSLVGSTAERVVRLSRRPVMVAVGARREPFRRVLAAIDLSEHSRAVLATAVGIARCDRAQVRALYVQEPPPPMLLGARLIVEDQMLRDSREEMERCLEAAGLPAGVEVDGRMREGHSGDEILEEARDWDADLIVVGSHGFGFFDRLLLGSTSIHVLRHGERTTVIVPRGAAEAP